MDRQEKAHWKCFGGSQECEHIPALLLLWEKNQASVGVLVL